jgi:hypothetical protein
LSSNPTRIRIYNRALALLGSANRSTSETDGKTWTDTLNEHWPQAVRELIAEHPWNFAIKRAALNESEDETPAIDSDSGFYTLPADCLRWLPWSRDNCHYFEGEQEAGGILAASGAEINVRYIALIEDVTKWPPHFVSLMAYRLAYDAAEALTQSSSITKARREAYLGVDGEGGQLAKAKRADALASGDRSRGNVVTRSRALSAAFSRVTPTVPGG